jgi:hypothetical protein
MTQRWRCFAIALGIMPACDASDDPAADAQRPDAAPVADAPTADAPSPDADVCPGASLNSANGHCYEYVAEAVTWLAARDACVNRGAYLATIADADENAFVSTLCGCDRWIGLNDLLVEGTFVWVTGEPVAYTNWSPGEPSNNSGVQHCVRMAADARWDDDECQAETGRMHEYICEDVP